jgi:phenylpyruvate tautomerase PptA (4-oxalocrotonate tautomerase family)
MPFLRLDANEGRTKEQVRGLLDAIHRAIVSAFGVPVRDRYQVYHEHPESNFIVRDTGLGIERTNKIAFIEITSKQRTEEQKANLYTELCEELKSCSIELNDMVVSIVTNFPLKNIKQRVHDTSRRLQQPSEGLVVSK